MFEKDVIMKGLLANITQTYDIMENLLMAIQARSNMHSTHKRSALGNWTLTRGRESIDRFWLV